MATLQRIKEIQEDNENDDKNKNKDIKLIEKKDGIKDKENN